MTEAVRTPGGERRLRVGVVVTSTLQGGAEAHIAQIFSNPTVAAAATGHLLGSMPLWSATGLPATDLGFGDKWSYRRAVRSVASMPRVLREGRRRIRELHAAEPFDAFYVHFKREQILLTRSLAAMAPVVWMEHGHLPSGRLRRPLLAAYRRAAPHVAAVVCVSESVRAELREVLGDAAPDPVVVENAIDPGWTTPPSPSQRRAARIGLGIEPGARLVVAVVGQLIPRKRVELAIDAAALLPGCWVVICGEGPLEADLRARAEGNPRVRFTGFLDDPRPVYAAADVNLLASREEGFGQVLLEGACAGLPAVVVADAGFGARVAGWGEVAEEPTAAAVAAAVEAAAARPHDAPRAWAEAHGPEGRGRAHLGVLRRVATAPGPPATP